MTNKKILILIKDDKDFESETFEFERYIGGTDKEIARNNLIADAVKFILLNF